MLALKHTKKTKWTLMQKMVFDLQRSYILPNSFAPTKITPSIWQYPQPIPPKIFGSIVQIFQISFSSNLDQIQTPWSKHNLNWTKNSQTLPDSLLCINTSPQKFSKIHRALWHFIIHLMCTVKKNQKIQNFATTYHKLPKRCLPQHYFDTSNLPY